MAKEIIVNASMAEETRIAILEDNRLIDLDIETQSRSKHKGNIYKGIVANIEDSLNAAFIEFGEEKQAFLPLSEVRPGLFPAEIKSHKRARISDVLKRGQEIIIQVTKDEIGNKGAAVSTYLSIPGRYVVLMHSDESGGGISRKIENENARKAARDILSRIQVPDSLAVIIRTAGMHAAFNDLLKDFEAVCETWKRIDNGAQLGRAPTILYKEPDIVIRTIRDYFSSDVAHIVIDEEEEYEDALNYFKDRMPDLVKTLERHRKKDPIFQHFGIEQEIEQLSEREVKLPSGGYIIIEQTEALVSIDVNSGKSTKEENHEATVYKTNLEAAYEIARQLRLRDLGGIIVIDFIDMVSGKHRRDVEKRLREAMFSDKAKTKVGIIGENGTLELTRQRLRTSHRLVSHIMCSYCHGTGRVRDVEGLAVSALRKIMVHLSKKRVPLSKITVVMPIDVANFLNNHKRRELVQLSDSHTLDIEIKGDPHISMAEIDFQEEKRGQAGLAAAQARDSRHDANVGARGGHDKWPLPAPTIPAPSIGPAPTLIEAVPGTEEDLDLQDAREPQAKQEFQRAPRVEVHNDDPIWVALFGDAPRLADKQFNLHSPAISNEADDADSYEEDYNNVPERDVAGVSDDGFNQPGNRISEMPGLVLDSEGDGPSIGNELFPTRKPRADGFPKRHSNFSRSNRRRRKPRTFQPNSPGVPPSNEEVQ